MSLIVLLAFACTSRTHMPVCEVLSETEVSDSEETALGSAQEMLDHLVLDHEGVGTWADGQQTQTQVGVSRGTGSAVLVEEYQTVRVSENRALRPPVDFYPAINVVCRDRLWVPLNLALRTEDGLLDLDLEGAGSVSLGQEEPYASAARGLGAEELPIFDRDPADYASKTLWVDVSAVDGALRAGGVSWSGRGETGSVSETVLELGGQ